MQNPDFTTRFKPVKYGLTAAGATNITYTTTDLTSGGLFDTVTMIVFLSVQVDTGTLRLRAYTCDDAAGTNPDLVDDVTGAEGQTGTYTNSTSANGMLILTVYRPKTPYVQFVLERAVANTTVTEAVALLSGARKEPIAIDSKIYARGLGLSR